MFLAGSRLTVFGGRPTARLWRARRGRAGALAHQKDENGPFSPSVSCSCPDSVSRRTCTSPRDTPDSSRGVTTIPRIRRVAVSLAGVSRPSSYGWCLRELRGPCVAYCFWWCTGVVVCNDLAGHLDADRSSARAV